MSVFQGVNKGRLNIVDITTTKTVTIEESGTVFNLNAAVGAVVTLPVLSSLTRGCYYKFFIGQATATTDWQIASTTAKMQGALLEAGLVLLIANGTTINFELATDVLGDWFECYSDGTNWIVDGVGSGNVFTVG
jgi:hypothetical protein